MSTNASRSYRLPDPALDHLASRWAHLKEEQPKLRIRDAAKNLGVSEAELIATQLGSSATLLRNECAPLFEAFKNLGTIMASTRNEWAVIEKNGTFDHVDIGEHMGVVLNHDIDLRIFVGHYNCVFAVINEDHTRGPLRSIQFFDKSGDSIHKVYVRADGDVAAFDELVETFRTDTAGELSFEPPTPLPVKQPVDIDVAAFQADWLAMTDTHEFFGLLRKHEISRLDAFRNAPPGHGIELPPEALQQVLETARDQAIPIMVFVSSRGCIEIHSGPIARVVEMGSWINVLDPEFNLHVQRDGIASGWIVRKPTEDGIVTSVEFFDTNEQLVLMTFGERKPGIPELESWRDLVRGLPTAA